MATWQRALLREALECVARDPAKARLLVGKVIRACDDPMVLRPLRRAYAACGRAMR